MLCIYSGSIDGMLHGMLESGMTEWMEMLAERILQMEQAQGQRDCCLQNILCREAGSTRDSLSAPGCISGSLTIETASYITMTPPRLICTVI